MLIKLEKQADFHELIRKDAVIVDFFATWCGPCKMLAPELEDLSNEEPNITIIEVDVDEYNELAAEFNIRAVPTLIYFKKGQIINQTQGFMDKNSVLSNLNK